MADLGPYLLTAALLLIGAILALWPAGGTSDD